MSEAVADCVIEDDRWSDAGLEALAARAVAATLGWAGLGAARSWCWAVTMRASPR